MNNMPREFYISPAGGSGNIGMSTFLTCPQKAYLYYNGWRRKKVSHAIGFGILQHKAQFDPKIKEDETRSPAELFENLYLKGVIPPYKKIDGSLEKEVEIEFTNNKGIPINKSKNLENGKFIAENVENNLANLPIKSFEKEMCVMLLDPETGKDVSELDGFFMCGRKDVQSNKITDLKTSAKSLTVDDINAGPYHYQLCSYRYMTIIADRTDYQELEIINAVNKANPEIKTISYNSTSEDLLMVFQTYLWVARQIKEYFRCGYWPRNPVSCKHWGLCDFHPICWPNQYSRPDIEIKKYLYKKGY